MVTSEMCNAYSGALNCGCCDTVAAFCNKVKGHEGSHRGECVTDDDFFIEWKTEK